MFCNLYYKTIRLLKIDLKCYQRNVLILKCVRIMVEVILKTELIQLATEERKAEEK